MNILFLVGEEFEDMEFFYPYYRMIEEGHTPKVAWKERGKVTGKHGYTINADLSFSEVVPKDFDALIIPGGRGPSHIRDDKDVMRITKFFFDSDKPVAAVCHGPQVLISSGVVKGKTLTSYSSVKQEVVSAGGNYLDKEVVVDHNLISSRQPSDLPYFTRTILEQLGKR
jgi:protease I